MMTSAPLVTIAIPTLNRSAFLRLTLASAMSQSYNNIEILVSDNASEDDTAAVLQSIQDERLRIVRQSVCLPMYPHWNQLVKAARGEYFLLLSDDDILEPDAVETMVARFKSQPSAGFVFCRGSVIDSNGAEVIPGKAAKSTLSAEEVMLGFFQSELDLWPCSILFRLKDLEGGYSEQFPLGADAAVWMRIVAKQGTAIFVNRMLTRYRVHRNTTATVGIHPWELENRRLAEYAIEQLRANGRGLPHSNEKLLILANRLNLRIAAGLIRDRATGGRLQSLLELFKHGGEFATPYGALVFSKAVIGISAPRSWRKVLVNWSRMIERFAHLNRVRERG
jgi:glycosyltransferase involved in cell wall biosynthesis